MLYNQSFLKYFIPVFCAWFLMVPAEADGGDDELVYYSTDDFEVSEFDRRMYLRKSPAPEDGSIGSRARNLQALSDIYALKLLAADAVELELLTERERDWIASYAVGLEIVNRYIEYEVDRRLNQTDWSNEALEVYLADPTAYELEERVSVRSLLIRTDERTEKEAIQVVSGLRIQAELPDTRFAELVRAETEDAAARENGGLMTEVRRGETVEPFETAAFALRGSGALSEPVVSEFGVHLIQLLERKAPRQRAFEEVKQQIIDELMPKRAAEYRQGVQHEARERTPAGFEEHTDALDALMRRTSDGLLGND